MNQIVTLEYSGEVAEVVIDNPPVNALGRDLRLALCEAFETLRSDPQVKAVVLSAANRCFVAGADIREFGKPLQAPFLPDLCVAIENMPVPVVAALHGVSLGGGLELALSAHYRIAHRAARVGLPEVTLGLIPGAGGTQRLPRLIGAERALTMISGGKPIEAETAFEWGLIDRMVDANLRTAGLDYARELLETGARVRPTSRLPAPSPVDWATKLSEVHAKARGRIAPLRAVDAVRASTEMSFAEGIKHERRLFLDLLETDQRKALVHAFFAEREVSKTPSLAQVKPRAMRHIGVVGGGTMGAGIAACALISGFDVSLVELSPEQEQGATDRLSQHLDGAVRHGKLSDAERQRALETSLTVSCAYEALASCDVVIEAVVEDMQIKQQVFAKLDAVCKPRAVLASNTSYLDIKEIAAATSRAEDVIGLHFFSPAHVMKLLEVVAPEAAGAETVATGFALGQRLGKTCVRSGVCDGFIGNRLLNVCRTAVDHMVLDGASPFDIDAAMVQFGYPMGPFQVSDLAGLDIGWAMRKRLAPTRGPHERVGRYPDRLCEAGHFGRKTGIGFYRYSDDGTVSEPNQDVLQIIAQERADLGGPSRTFAPDEIQRRYMSAMVNEAARILEEKIARYPRDIDVVLMYGYAFPRYLGGPCKWADLRGLETVLQDIQNFALEDPHFWQPAPLLIQLVREQKGFDNLNPPRDAKRAR